MALGRPHAERPGSRLPCSQPHRQRLHEAGRPGVGAELAQALPGRAHDLLRHFSGRSLERRFPWSDLSRMRVLRGHPLHAANACVTLLNHMVQYITTRLDTSFAALSDATRRGVLEQLGRADASITDLAEKFHMTLTGMKKHVGVLEQAGLVTTKKIGRVRNCQLGPRRLEEETAWLERYRQRWDERFDELDKVVEELTRKEKSDERKNRK